MSNPECPLSSSQIQDAIIAWRNGKTFDAIHPFADLPNVQTAIFWDDNAMKDLARVIHHAFLEEAGS